MAQAMHGPDHEVERESPSECIWSWVEGHVLFWCSFEVHGSLVMLLFWGHVLRKKWLEPLFSNSSG